VSEIRFLLQGTMLYLLHHSCCECRALRAIIGHIYRTATKSSHKAMTKTTLFINTAYSALFLRNFHWQVWDR